MQKPAAASKPAHPAEPAIDPKAKARQQQSAQSQKDKQRKARAALDDLRHGKDGPVLAGVDYLHLAHGGRRKANDEAAKMARLRAEGEATHSAEPLGAMKL